MNHKPLERRRRGREPRPEYDFSEYMNKLRQKPGRKSSRFQLRVLEAIQKYQTTSPIRISSTLGLNSHDVECAMLALRKKGIPIPYVSHIEHKSRYDLSEYMENMRRYSPRWKKVTLQWTVMDAIQKHHVSSPLAISKILGIDRIKVRNAISQLKIKGVPIPRGPPTGRPTDKRAVQVGDKILLLTPEESGLLRLTKSGKEWKTLKEISKSLGVTEHRARYLKQRLDKKLEAAGIPLAARFGGVTIQGKVVPLTEEQMTIYGLMQHGITDRRKIAEELGFSEAGPKTKHNLYQRIFKMNRKLKRAGSPLLAKRAMPTWEQIQEAIKNANYNYGQAARDLGVSYIWFHGIIRQHGVPPKKAFTSKGVKPGCKYTSVDYGGRGYILPPREAKVLSTIVSTGTTNTAVISKITGFKRAKVGTIIYSLRKRGIPINIERKAPILIRAPEVKADAVFVGAEKLKELKGKVLSGRLPLRIIKTEIRMKLLEDPDIKRALVEGRISEIE